MTDIAEREQYSVIGVMQVSEKEVGNYGVVESEAIAGRVSRVSRIIEKPKPGITPSRLAVVGRYILSPRIFHHLRTMPAGANGEIQLTDGIARLLEDEKVLAYEFEGRRYDCGNKLGYLEATVELGVKHPDIGADFAAFLKRRR
jgi:UTP--glucose-1-phosphate uridylyltransferase